MVNAVFIIIDVLSLMISLFCIYATYSIYLNYKLKHTLAFVITSVGILLWNISHIFYDTIPSNNSGFSRFIWYLANVVGAVVILSTIHGFSTIRNEYLSYKLVVYYVIISVFLTSQLLRRDILDLEYNETNDHWQSVTKNEVLWNLYILVIFSILIIELFYPLIVSYKNIKHENKTMLTLLLIGALFATLSNLLLPILTLLDLPQVIRHFTANLGLLAVFWVLYKHPFLGFYDEVQIYQIIVANTSGLPIFYTNNPADAFLATGALYGVETILTEISYKVGVSPLTTEETTRKIELPDNQFYIIKVNKTIIIYHYSNHSGTSLLKFKSLARIFREREMKTELLIGAFQADFADYFPNLKSMIFPKNLTLAENII